ncbi:hairy-related 11 [Etheostoma cragini]|uniref:hairy-related 11 n=1 Tax=Etheostoma cragini TaxID=417921 RepID=UPI00155F3EB0|nr:hairy-related 11 [Etheostoma cragini]
MTRKLQNPSLEDGKRKRVLKPVVEKKRRDRINQSLAELRSLLLSHTSDPRLQNPKIEKAEILDLAVEYVQKLTGGKTLRKDSTDGHVKTPVVSLHRPESSAPPLFTIESAGFQQCVAQLTSYMHKIPQAQRTKLLEGLKHHTESQQPNTMNPESDHRRPETDTAKGPDGPCGDAICTSERKFPSCSPFQPHSCSTPCHDYLSPPPSPWLSPSFSTYVTSPPFPSFTSHFSFPPSLSPLSSNTSFFSFSPPAPHTGLHCPPLITLRSPTHPAQREGSLTNSSSLMWRPWF